MTMRRESLLLIVLSWALNIHAQIVSSANAENSKFIGYYVAPDSTQSLTAGAAWVTSGAYAGDCKSSSGCPMATACNNGVLSYDNSQTLTCGTFSCVEMTIYQRSPNAAPSAFNYACRAGWAAHTVYRELPATTTSSSSLASSTMAPAPSTLLSTASSTSTTTSTPSTTPSATPSQSDQPNMAWIAGAVIGPIVGIALICAVVFWWRRRRSQQIINVHGHAHELGSTDYMSGQGQPVEKYTHGAPPSELASGQYQPSELMTREHPSELPGARY